MVVLGVAPCKTGWMCFQIGDDGAASFSVVEALSVLVERRDLADVILVAVPVGLLDEGPDERQCDTESRRLLGAGDGGRSILPVPCREAVYAPDFKTANDINRKHTGRSLSLQSWGQVSGIQEVDQLIRSSEAARSRLREVHPELLYWALAGGRPMTHSKETQEGLVERVMLLESAYQGAEELAAAAFVDHGGFRVAREDVIDALVAAVVGRVPENLRTVPVDPPLDSLSIPMEIVYRYR